MQPPYQHGPHQQRSHRK